MNQDLVDTLLSHQSWLMLGVLVLVVIYVEVRTANLRRTVAKLDRAYQRDLRREADQRLVDDDTEFLREIFRILDRPITKSNIERVYDRIGRLAQKLSHQSHLQLQSDIRSLCKNRNGAFSENSRRLLELKVQVGKAIRYY